MVSLEVPANQAIRNYFPLPVLPQSRAGLTSFYLNIYLAFHLFKPLISFGFITVKS